MSEPGADRWKELLQGRRCWAAADLSRESLIRFALEVADPLKAMEDARMVRLEIRSSMVGDIRCDHEIRILEVAEWVHDLARRNERAAG